MKQLFSDVDKKQQKNIGPGDKGGVDKYDHLDFIPRGNFQTGVQGKQSNHSLVIVLN